MRHKPDTGRLTSFVFRYTEEALLRPRRVKLQNGKTVGIGGSIRITPSPPSLPYTVPEITSEELRVLLTLSGTSFDHLVIVEPVKEKEDVSDLSHDDT